MKTWSEPRKPATTAFTKVDLVWVILILGLLLALMAPALVRFKDKSQRIGCVSRLKNIGLGFRIFSTDSMGRFPWQVASSNGGTREFVSDASQAWRHFSRRSAGSRSRAAPAEAAEGAATS